MSPRMGNGIAAVRAHARWERFQKAAKDATVKLATWPWKPVRVSTELAKHILLKHETLMSNGRLYSTQVRNIGAGVKELYLVEHHEGGGK